MSETLGLDAVNCSFLPRENGGKEPYPLVISPRWDDSLLFWINWCQQNRKWVDEKLLHYGAILIRGFDLSTSSDMEKAIQAFQPKLNNTYRGTSPRKVMDGTEYVFSAAEVPVNYPIAQHIEMSFLPAPPKQLYFGCIKPSAKAGGETALADFRKVYQDLPQALREKLLVKGIRYQRTHKKVGAYFTYDVADMLSWPQLFGTNDKAEIERICAQEGMHLEWHGDTFVNMTQSQAFQLHPQTKDPVWFNHSQVFHWTSFPAELWLAWKRCGDWRLLLHCLFVTVFCIIKYGILRHKMCLHVTFGDGEAISVKEMQTIRAVIHKNMIFSRWQKGDLLLIDNFSMSHGRQPTYDKGRKIVVAWADPVLKTNELTAVSVVSPNGAVNVNDVSLCLENPQERTPESTLTGSESKMLQQELLTKDIQTAFHDNPQELSEYSMQKLQGMYNGTTRDRTNLHRKTHSQPTVSLKDVWDMSN